MVSYLRDYKLNSHNHKQLKTFNITSHFKADCHHIIRH